MWAHPDETGLTIWHLGVAKGRCLYEKRMPVPRVPRAQVVPTTRFLKGRPTAAVNYPRAECLLQDRPVYADGDGNRTLSWLGRHIVSLSAMGMNLEGGR